MIAQLRIIHSGAIATYLFETEVECRAIYDKLKTAMDRYESFRNKEGESIEFSTGANGDVTVRLATLQSVGIDLDVGLPDWLADYHAQGVVNQNEIQRRAKALVKTEEVEN